ncbi:MAG: PrsW family glutamic-type intramembrane protease [Chloroflexota bacterium]|nr:PrsW family glutamic-type intramembrane protease [Chloroflexota bacterium]
MDIILGLILSFLATAIPALLYIAIIWWLDRYEREPIWLLTVTFLWGAVPAIILALIAQLILDYPFELLGPGIAASVGTYGITPPLTEETVKALAVLGIFLFYRQEFDNVLDGIVYGALVGFGFSVTEDLFAFLGTLFTEGWGAWGVTVLLRTGLYALNHSFFTACTGAALGYARLSRETWKKILVPVLGLGAAMIFHSLHNLGAVFAEQTVCLSLVVATLIDWGGVLVLLAIMLLTARQERMWIVTQLQGEVTSGLISPAEYALASAYMERFRTRWRALTQEGWQRWRQWGRFFGLITDLAFKKHQLQAAGEGVQTVRIIDRLRQQIADLRTQMGLGMARAETFCGQCGSALTSQHNFCPKCGREVDWPRDAS